jgi:hypothetical protein
MMTHLLHTAGEFVVRFASLAVRLQERSDFHSVSQGGVLAMPALAWSCSSRGAGISWDTATAVSSLLLATLTMLE